MKNVRILYLVISSIPIAWLFSLLIILLIGSFYLGYIPKYGNHFDPYSIGLAWIGFFECCLCLFTFFSFLIWPVFTGSILSIPNEKNIVLNKLSVILYITGLISVIIFRYSFSEFFLWVED